MTPKSLWILLIRILGIYFIFQLFLLLPQLVSNLLSYRSMNYSTSVNDNSAELFWRLGYFGGIAFLLLIITRYCLFKTIWLIDKLSLDQDFTEEVITLKGDKLVIINTAVIIIAGVMLADAIPLLLKNLFTYFQQINNYRNFKDSPTAIWIIFFGIKFIIGYLMISFSRSITLYINAKSKWPDDTTPSNNAE